VHIRGIAGVVAWVLLLLVAPAGCGHVPEGRSHHQGHGTVVQGVAQDSAALPAGYDPITSLVGDPDGTGVWFWDDTKSELSIFHIDSQGNLQSWPVLTGAANEFQAISGFAVTSAGIAWLGINSTLTRLDSSSGTARTWQIPAPARNPAAESFQPSGQQSQHLVQGIAVAADGSHVAIAMSNASSVEIFDASAGTFTQIAMPAASDDPVAVAYAGDGTLGIAVASYTTHREDSALLVAPGGAGSPVVVRVADSSAIASDRAEGFIVGSTRPSLVTTAGTATPIVLPLASLIPVHAGLAINVMPDGDLAAITSAGILEFPANASSAASATSASVTLQLPAEQCQPEAPSYEVGTPTTPQPSPTGSCHPEADAMTVDSSGGVWVVPGTGGASVERLGT
jgi:hypothetical protein